MLYFGLLGIAFVAKSTLAARPRLIDVPVDIPMDAIKPISPNNQCGPANGYACGSTNSGPCCDKWGWCNGGQGCLEGCQPDYGICGSQIFSTQTPTTISTALVPPNPTVSPSVAPLPAPVRIFEGYPALIIPLKEEKPDTPAGTQQRGYVTRTPWAARNVRTEVLFNVPSNDATLCRLNFRFPNPSKAGCEKLCPFSLHSGAPPYVFNISALVGNADQYADTWNSHPVVGDEVATVEIVVSPTNGQDMLPFVTGGVVPCLKGQPQSFLLWAEGSRRLDLEWFEQVDPQSGIVYEMWK